MKFCIFDVDGTIVDSMEFWENLGKRYIESKGINVEEGLSKKLEELTVEQGISYIHTKYLPNMSEKEILDELTFKVYKYFKDEVQLKPYVKEYIAKIYDEGNKLYVLSSNEKDVIEKAFNRLGILKYFSDIYTVTSMGISKSKCDLYKKVMEDIGANPKDCIFYEDTLYAIKPMSMTGALVYGIYDGKSKKDEDKIKSICDKYIYGWEELL